METELFHADEQRDRDTDRQIQTGMTEIKVAFSSFANGPQCVSGEVV